jgi:multidrug transporter EmrE-like cation transporter
MSAFVLMYFMLGGTFEFFGSLTLSASFFYGGLARMNVGICASMLSCNTVLILFVSRYVFMQKIQSVQVLGVLLLVVAVAMISIFSVPVVVELQTTTSAEIERVQYHYQ